jgi:hypothetical protein
MASALRGCPGVYPNLYLRSKAIFAIKNTQGGGKEEEFEEEEERV